MSKSMTDKICLIACIILICMASAITISATLTTPKVIGSDFYFHLNIAEYLARGDFSGAWNQTLNVIKFPYALYAFHSVFLAPAVWSGNPMLISKIYQTLFLPLTYALTLFIAYKYGSPKAAVITGLILLGCWSFTDGALQVRPESIDLLFYPIIVYALMQGKKKLFAGLSIFTVYSHGPAAIANIYGFALKKLHEKAWRKTIAATVLIVLPIIILSLLYINGAFAQWGGTPINENPQEYDFWHNPVFIPYYMGATIIGVPFLLRRHKNEIETLLTWGVAASIIMLPMWADRWLHYISLPLAILAGIGISRFTESKSYIYKILGITLIAAATIIGVSYWLGFIQISWLNQWWQPIA